MINGENNDKHHSFCQQGSVYCQQGLVSCKGGVLLLFNMFMGHLT